MEAKAYSQVSFIIGKMSEELRKKIPEYIIHNIEDKKDKSYKIDVDKVSNLELMDDTRKILSVLYTDYIAPVEEKAIIKNKERLIKLREEEEKKRVYTSDLFYDKMEDLDDDELDEETEGKNTEEDNNKKSIVQSTLIIAPAEEKWYQKLEKMLRKFGKLLYDLFG
ncbi:MAG: hypothetical protein IKG56_04890 [Clostridia bacterium]|nr:hypothetical protein [Clostridia bacterium]